MVVHVAAKAVVVAAARRVERLRHASRHGCAAGGREVGDGIPQDRLYGGAGAARGRHGGGYDGGSVLTERGVVDVDQGG